MLDRKAGKCGAVLEITIFQGDIRRYKAITNQSRQTLIGKVSNMPKTSTLYARNPEKDFTRTRKFPFDIMMMTLISMGGNTLSKKLMD